MRGRPGHAASRAGALAALLAFAGAACAPTPPPTPARAAVVDGATTVTVISQDAARAPLDGFVRRPAGAGPFPALVLMHGCGGMWTRERELGNRERFWSGWLADQGYLTLLLDSYTTRGIDELCTKRDRALSGTRDRPHDAYGALAYLRSRADVVAERVAVWGWSNGAMAALATIAEQRPERGFRAAVGLYPGCGLDGTFDATGWSAQAPTLILVGEADDWTPAARCRELVERARGRGAPITLRGFAGAYHAFDSTNPVRTRTVNNPLWPASRTVTVGGDPAARAAAVEEVRAFLATAVAR